MKRALYLDPFEWLISYNLGLVHLNKQQYASAFHFFSASINLNPNFAATYMYLAITLARLDDFDNSCAAYQKSIEINENESTTRLNYAITLFNNDEMERSREQFEIFERIFAESGEGEDEPDQEVLAQSAELREALKNEE